MVEQRKHNFEPAEVRPGMDPVGQARDLLQSEAPERARELDELFGNIPNPYEGIDPDTGPDRQQASQEGLPGYEGLGPVQIPNTPRYPTPVEPQNRDGMSPEKFNQAMDDIEDILQTELYGSGENSQHNRDRDIGTERNQSDNSSSSYNANHQSSGGYTGISGEGGFTGVARYNTDGFSNADQEEVNSNNSAEGTDESVDAGGAHGY